MGSADWLRAFLDQRQLTVADGRPLYSYRCSSAEFQTLGNLLSGVPLRSVIRSLRVADCACFCLYAAEWWRRNHEGGAWRWRDILAAIGWDEAELPQLYPIVQEGLVRHWRRELLTLWGKRGFLVTLACEGGLPLRLLQKQQTKLRRYFHDLLQEFSVFGRSGLPPSELAARVSDRLPPSLRHDVVYELSGRLTGRIWQLQIELGDSRTPVATLDKKHPTWRESLPLVVEDDIARVLLNNLVEDASRIAFRRTAGFSLARRLRRSGQEWILEGEVRWPGRIPAADLAALLAMRSDSLPPRFQLLLEDDGGSSSLFALVTHLGSGDEESRYVIEVPPRTSTIFRSIEAAQERRLVAVASGQEVGRIDINGGAGLGELPWAFVESAADSELLDYIGEGGVRTRHTVVVVALGSCWRVDEESCGTCERIGEVPTVGRGLWRVSGTVSFIDDDGNRCQIHSGAASDETIEFYLSGSTLPYGSGTAPLFLGVPSVYQRKSGGIMDAVDRTCIEWRPAAARKGWRPIGPECLGDVMIRAVSGGDARFRTRAQVLPEGAGIELIPGRSGRDGRLRLQGLRNLEVGVEPLEHVRLKITGSGTNTGLIDIDVVADREPPATLDCRLRWPAGQQLGLQVPFPVRVGRYVGRDGTALKRDATVCVDQLVGVLATVVDAEQGGKFVIEGRMHADDVGPEIANALWIHAPLVSRDGRRHELDLRAIQGSLKGMMALTKDLDALFRLKIESKSPTPLPPRALFVSRYDWDFELDRDTEEVRLSERSLLSIRSDELAHVRVEARPLWIGDREPVVLQSSGVGRWLFESTKRQPGPWLILGWDGGWCRARPTLWDVPDCVDTDPAGSNNDVGQIAVAARIGDPTTRSAAYDVLIDRMAQDPDHPEWEPFFAYLDGYEGVPKNTLALFDRFVENFDAVALALLLANTDRFDKLWYAFEELPFSWALVPLRSWVRGARRLFDSLQAAKLPATFITSAFDTFFSRAPVRLPVMAVVAQLVARIVLKEDRTVELGPTLAIQNAQQMHCQRQIAALQGDLLRSHADDRWPPGPNVAEFRGLLGKIPKQLDKLWFELPPGVGYQSSVINAPIAVALASACGGSVDRLRICELRRLRDFAPDYFDRASAYALSWAAGVLLDSVAEVLG